MTTDLRPFSEWITDHQAQCFARWSMANDPTRLWHQRARWVR